VDGDGWKRIAYDNDVIFYNMLSELIAAKGSGSTVNLTISNDAITQVFVNA